MIYKTSAYFITIVLVLSGTSPSFQAGIKNTELVNFEEYMTDVIQTFLYDLEDNGLSNLRMRDFSIKFNKTYYGFEVIGDLHFSNGFLVGLKSASIKLETSTLSIGSYLDDDGMYAQIYTTLSLTDLKITYDLVANLKGQDIISNGVYPVKQLEYKINIMKNLTTEEISSQIYNTGIQQLKGGKMEFLPSSDYTVVIGREISTLISDIGGSFADWAKEDGYLTQSLRKVVEEKGNFPKIDFDSSDNI